MLSFPYSTIIVVLLPIAILINVSRNLILKERVFRKIKAEKAGY